MADKITWADKESLVTDPTIAEINKVTDDNMNEIKSVTNTNADELAEKIVYDENDITENTSMIIEEVPEGSNIPYINSEIAIGSSNEDNRPVWFKQSKNLFNKDIAVNGFIAGAYNNNDSWYYTPITNWKVGDTLVTSGGRAIISFFNGTTNISYSDITNATITIPANTTIVYVSTLKTNTQFQIEIGSTASDYEPYAITSIVLNSNNEIYRKPHKEILWSGDVTDANAELPLSENYTNFEKVGICYGPHNTNHKLYMEIYTEDLPNGADIDLFVMQTPSIYASCDLKPTNDKKITINSTANQMWGKIHITKIYGINRIN